MQKCAICGNDATTQMPEQVPRKSFFLRRKTGGYVIKMRWLCARHASVAAARNSGNMTNPDEYA